jgi:hypothetical protein
MAVILPLMDDFGFRDEWRMGAMRLNLPFFRSFTALCLYSESSAYALAREALESQIEIAVPP